MVKALLFDFWGTLVENGVWSPSKQVRSILRIDLPFPDFICRMEEAMMTKKFPELKDAFLAIGEEFQKEIPPPQMEILIGMWNKAWMLAKPYLEVEEILSSLQGKYDLFLVSNTDCFSLNRVQQEFALQKYFKKVYLSYEQGLIKTNPELLKRILKENKLSAEECVMIGDSLESDILPAKQVGLKTILLDRKNNREFHPKIKSLEELETALQWN